MKKGGVPMNAPTIARIDVSRSSDRLVSSPSLSKLIQPSSVITETIMSLVNARRNLIQNPLEAASDVNLALMRQRSVVETAVNNHKSILFVLPAFPAKSPNHKKVIGASPDLGEVAALIGLNKLCENIKNSYSPGARIVICSDGRVFSDLVQVADSEVTSYTRSVERIIKDFELWNLSIFNLEDVFEGDSFEQMRKKLIDDYADSVSTVRLHSMQNADGRQMFNGIHRFMFEDTLVLEPSFSRNRAREISKQITYSVIQRSNAWSRLVEAHFPQALRFSIHPQPLHSNKIGIGLLPSDDIWRTPWHSAPVATANGIKLTWRSEAETQGAQAKYFHHANQEYGYFALGRENEFSVLDLQNVK